MTRLLLPTLAMAAIVLASNILVQFLFGQWLTWGAFTYPLAFLVTDLTNRLHGPAAARRVVVAGFLTGIAASVIAAGLERTTLRIALGSGAAFVAAQMTDVLIFDRLRAGRWWRAPLASTLVGSALDTALFFTIAFSAVLSGLLPGDAGWANAPVPVLGAGPQAPLWVSLALADWGVKLALAVISLVPFRLILRRALAPVA